MEDFLVCRAFSLQLYFIESSKFKKKIIQILYFLHSIFSASLNDKLGELDKALSENSYEEEDDVFASNSKRKGEIFNTL